MGEFSGETGEVPDAVMKQRIKTIKMYGNVIEFIEKIHRFALKK